IAAANDLILVFLALELLSLSLYVLTGITGRRRASEAAMKYFLLGAFSSAFFLYGVAMAYGATASTKIVGVGAPGIVQARSGATGWRARGGRGHRPGAVGADRLAGARVPRRRAPRDRIRLQGLGGAVPHVDPGRLPGCSHPGRGVHERGDEGGGGL